MDDYGLTENEKQTSLHSYNHALFKNMMFFMNAVWEINIPDKTIIVMEDRDRPEKSGMEYSYEEVYREYLDNYVDESERDVFCEYFDADRVSALSDEVSFDLHLNISNKEPELYNIVLTPAYDENHRLYSVYLGARNLQSEVRREFEEYHRQKQFLSALLSTAYFHVSFDLTGDRMIEEDFVSKDGKHLLKELTGMDVPISYETFLDKWFERCEPKLEDEDGRRFFSVDNLLELYRKKQHLVDLEVQQKSIVDENIQHIMQIFIVLMTTPEDKHVKAYIIWKDMSSFQRKTLQDNIELRSSNEYLKNTLNQELQYRLASVSGALLVYNINLTRNLIEDEFYEIVDNRRIPMLELVGLKPPCSFDEFCRRWCETKVPVESRETFLSMFNREYMLNAYENGERHMEIEFDTVLGRGIRITLRNTAFLLEDTASGDILAMVNSKDVSKQRAEEKKQREALRNAYEVANNANVAKTDFLSRLSHDFRKPMNAIIGMAAIATNHLDNTSRVEECLKEITTSGKYLLSILTEVLDMSKIESGKFELNEKTFEIPALFDNIYMVSRFLCKEKEQDFSTRINKLEHTTVVGDSVKLQQVLMYMIDNSIKYTPNGGSIMLTATEKHTDAEGMARYEIILEDNGIGMDEEYRQFIFEPFVRSEDSRVSKIQGVGLGLPITKSIIRMMNGDIYVLSEKDKGTVITIDITFKVAE